MPGTGGRHRPGRGDRGQPGRPGPCAQSLRGGADSAGQPVSGGRPSVGGPVAHSGLNAPCPARPCLPAAPTRRLHRSRLALRRTSTQGGRRMKLASFTRLDGNPAVGKLIDDDKIMDLTGAIPHGSGISPIRALLMSTGGRPGEIVAGPDADVFPLAEVQLLPVVTDPGKLIAAPVNYVDHQEEMNEA